MKFEKAQTHLSNILNQDCFGFDETSHGQQILSILQRFPRLAQQTDQQIGVCPLFSILFLRPSLSLVKTIYKHYPQAVQQICFTMGRLPLHLACFANLEDSMIFLASKYPNGLMVASQSWGTPLHMICSRGIHNNTNKSPTTTTSADTLRCLAKINPQALTLTSGELIPLDWALANPHFTPQYIKALMDLHPIHKLKLRQAISKKADSRICGVSSVVGAEVASMLVSCDNIRSVVDLCCKIRGAFSLFSSIVAVVWVGSGGHFPIALFCFLLMHVLFSTILPMGK
eukprot:CAMPEP_0116830450 /NCGR_PEP_ID=MMETSP0418-20121206/4768_1 /TAXON_ID=1158023 /ORGANISM="Astrosyne radiata, Strain 13vi08-1A" /LENGTH=284 /DNA_ID=CAMNT_0004459551 /DNA_START=505 /DNA_END=1359 /DNA_ORIENTATION=-